MTIIKKRVKSNNRYSLGLKRKIAKEYLSGKASYGILAEEHGLRDKSVVKEFVKWYRRQLEAEKQENEEELEENEITNEGESARIKELEKRLRELELKAEMLETIIDIAEENFGIAIRKKPGAKQ